MKIENDKCILSTGRSFYANNGILGMADDLRITEGYDGGMTENFTSEERVEIADYVIALWQKWKKKK